MTTRQTVTHLSFNPNEEIPVKDFLEKLNGFIAEVKEDFGALTFSFDAFADGTEADDGEILLYISGHPKHVMISRMPPNPTIYDCCICDYSRTSDVHI